MTHASSLPAPLALRARARRRTATWARIVVGLLAALVPLAIVLGGSHAARPDAAARAVVADVVGALAAQHETGGAWPSSLILDGRAVVDADSGRRVTTVPSGAQLAYERSVDGTRFVLRVSAAGSRVAFDSAHPAG